MRIVGVNCSPRRGRTTQRSLEICLEAARDESDDIRTDIVELAGLDIRGCLACGYCERQLKCKQEDDFNSLISVLNDKELAGIVIGTPVYFGTMASQCKAFLDRCVMFRRNGFIFRNKIGGVLAVGGVRNGGQELTIQAVQAAMLCHDMVCVGDGMSTAHFGAALWSGGSGGIERDETGLETARHLGRRLAQIAVRIGT